MPVCWDCGKGPRAIEDETCTNCGNEIEADTGGNSDT